MTLLSAVEAVDETPIDRFLAEQADFTAVTRFAQRHEADLLPRQARYYRDLLPLTAPGPGQQYGFEVDLDACTGCKACVAGCHSLNGLDDGESWRSVTLLRGGTTAQPIQQTVTGACHHCVEPACLNGCPVDAYEKDPTTGIVAHLDDQCIGCSYCTLTCPYEVPVLNQARGIVRKCDLCTGRLAEGEAPACVQACPNGAISIALVDTAAAHAAAGSPVVPGAPPSSITVPTTVYRTTRAAALETAARTAPAGPAHAHPPLAVMLVLTQLSVGAFVLDLVRALLTDRASVASFDAVVAVAVGTLALGASVFHLGRPRYAYRAVIGLRHSWLSREVVAFGAFTGLAALYAGVLALRLPFGGTALGVAAAAAGLAGVACSVMVYAVTRRPSWRLPSVAVRFGLTTAAGGVATVLWASTVSGRDTSRTLPVLLVALMAMKLAFDAPLGRAIAVLRRTATKRFAAGAVGGVVLPLVVVASGGQGWLGMVAATGSVAGVVAGELLERSLFFTTAAPPR